MTEPIRAGDHVKHHPTGETWVVRRVLGEHLEWFGWPPGQAYVWDCERTYACTEEEHEDALAGHLPRRRAKGRCRMAEDRASRFSQAERILELETALGAILETCLWYQEGNGTEIEAAHALRVEIPDQCQGALRGEIPEVGS